MSSRMNARDSSSRPWKKSRKNQHNSSRSSHCQRNNESQSLMYCYECSGVGMDRSADVPIQVLQEMRDIIPRRVPPPSRYRFDTHEHCDNCMRTQKKKPPSKKMPMSIHSQPHLRFELSHVSPYEIRNLHSPLRQVPAGSKGIFKHGANGNDDGLGQYFALCNECRTFLSKTPTELKGREKADFVKKQQSWDCQWPSFMWNILSGFDSETGIYFHQTCHPEKLWKFIPRSLRHFWYPAIRGDHDAHLRRLHWMRFDRRRHLSLRSVYWECRLNYPEPYFVDRTANIDCFHELTQTRRVKDLLKILTRPKPMVMPDCLCPWGCTEFFHATSGVNIGVLIQHHLREVRLNLPSAKLHDELIFVESSRNDYFRDVEIGDSYDNVLLNKAWPIMPSCKYESGQGLVAMTCRHHASNTTRKRLYPHPPRKPMGHNLSPESPDRLAHCKMQSKNCRSIKCGKFNTTFRMDVQQASFSGVHSSDVHLGRKSDFSHMDEVLFDQEACSYAGRKDIQLLANAKVVEEHMDRDYAVELEQKAESFYPSHVLSRFRQGATFVNTSDSMHLHRHPENENIIVVRASINNHGEVVVKDQVRVTRSWGPTINFMQTEDASLFGTAMKPIPAYRARLSKKRPSSHAVMVQWVLASCIVGCKELHVAIDQKTKPFHELNWAGHMLAHLHSSCHRYQDNRIARGSPFKNKTPASQVLEYIERDLPDEMILSEGRDDISSELFFRFNHTYVQNLFKSDDIRGVSVKPSVEEATKTGAFDSDKTTVVIVVSKNKPRVRECKSAPPCCIRQGDDIFEIRVINCITVDEVERERRDRFEARRFTRHGHGYHAWWEQARTLPRKKKEVINCAPLTPFMKKNISTGRTNSLPDLEDDCFFYVTVYVKISNPKVEDYRIEFHRSIGGQCHVYCDCEQDPFPLIESCHPKEKRETCTSEECDNDATYQCSSSECKTKLCKRCLENLPSSVCVEHEMDIVEIQTEVPVQRQCMDPNCKKRDAYHCSNVSCATRICKGCFGKIPNDGRKFYIESQSGGECIFNQDSSAFSDQDHCVHSDEDDDDDISIEFEQVECQTSYDHVVESDDDELEFFDEDDVASLWLVHPEEAGEEEEEESRSINSLYDTDEVDGEEKSQQDSLSLMSSQEPDEEGEDESTMTLPLNDNVAEEAFMAAMGDGDNNHPTLHGSANGTPTVDPSYVAGLGFKVSTRCYDRLCTTRSDRRLGHIAGAQLQWELTRKTKAREKCNKLMREFNSKPNNESSGKLRERMWKEQDPHEHRYDEHLTYAPFNPLDRTDDPDFRDSSIPSTNAGEVPVDCQKSEQNNSSVPWHVLFNQAGSLLTRYNRRISGTQVQKNFIQRVVSKMRGYSSQLLYISGLIFPSHFWSCATKDYSSILGSAPLFCYTSALNPHGMASSLSQARNLITHSSSSTSTDPKVMGFLYDIQANKVAGGIDSRIISRHGFKVDVKSNKGLVPRGENKSDLTDSVDSHQAALDLAGSTPFVDMDLFLTFTCNQASHPGISQFHAWKESMAWLEGYGKDGANIYHHSINDNQRRIKRSFEGAYGAVLGRIWMEVRKLWLEQITYGVSTNVGKVLHVFYRDEYQEFSGNLPHIHGLVALKKEDYNNPNLREMVAELQACSVGELFDSTKIQEYIDQGLFENEEDWTTLTALAGEILPHRCNPRCQRRIGDGEGPENFVCRKIHPVFGREMPSQHEFAPLKYEFTQGCLDALRKCGLWTPPQKPEDPPLGTFEVDQLNPKRHIGAVHPGARDNMSPVNPELFAFTRSMQNLQIVTGTNSVAKYLVKYIVKLDKGNRCTVWADSETGSVLKVEKEFLHNTKITSSKMNEEAAHKKSRNFFHPSGRAIAFTEMQQHILGYPEVTTTLKFVRISTKPYELRSSTRISMNENGDVLEPSHNWSQQNKASSSARTRNNIHQPTTTQSTHTSESPGLKARDECFPKDPSRQLTDDQRNLMLLNGPKICTSDKVTEFGLRPMELMQLIRNPGIYHRWFHIEPNWTKMDAIMGLLDEDVTQSRLFDGVGRLVQIRKNARKELLDHLENLDLSSNSITFTPVSLRLGKFLKFMIRRSLGLHEEATGEEEERLEERSHSDIEEDHSHEDERSFMLLEDTDEEDERNLKAETEESCPRLLRLHRSRRNTRPPHEDDRSFMSLVDTDEEDENESMVSPRDPYDMDNFQRIFLFDDKDDPLPIPVYSSVTPRTPIPFVLHFMLMLGEYDTELDMKKSNTMKEIFQKLNLIDSDLSDDENVNRLVKLVVKKVLRVQPVTMRRMDEFIVQSRMIFQSLIVENSFHSNDLPSCLLTQILQGKQKEFDELRTEIRKNVIEAIYGELLGSGVEPSSLPPKEHVLNATKNDPWEWNAIEEFRKSPNQPQESYNEQKLAIDLGIRSVDKYCKQTGREALVLSKGVITEGSPGSGKSFVSQYISLYALCKGLNVTPTALMAARANALGGIHIHRLFCLPIHRYANSYRTAEVAMEKMNRKSQLKYLHVIRTTDLFCIDECGQLSDNNVTELDIICRKSRGSERPFGGALVFGTMDHTQLGAIKGNPFLLSTHVLTSFNIVNLRHSVRASDDENFQKIQNITRMSPKILKQSTEIKEQFFSLMENFITFVDDWEKAPLHAKRLYARKMPAYDASREFVESTLSRLKKDYEQNYVVSMSEDTQRNDKTREEFGKRVSSVSVLKKLNHGVKEPEKLLFYEGALFEATLNRENYSQSQLMMMTDVPSEDAVKNMEKIHLWVAPTTVKDVDLSQGIPTKQELQDQGWKEVQVEANEGQPITFKGVQARRKQYGLKHVLASTINKQMGNTIRGQCAIECTKECRPWQKEQVVVALSRTTKARDTVIVGEKKEAIKHLWNLLTVSNQWTEYIENLLNTLSINGDVALNRQREPERRSSCVFDVSRFHPYRKCDLDIPTDESGYVYMLVSLRDTDRTYIGQTKNLARRFGQHQCGNGAEATKDPMYRPWSIGAYMCKMGHLDGEGRRALEEMWSNRITREMNDGRMCDVDERIRLGIDTCNEWNRTKHDDEKIRFVRLWDTEG